MEKPEFLFALREDLKEEKQFLPTKAEPKATGFDVRAAMPDRKPLIIKPFQYVKIPLGFRSFSPEGWWYQLFPRSSSFTKKYLHALYGVIDETYENELVFACQYIPEVKIATDHNLKINFGDAIGQLIPVRRQEMEIVEVSNEDYNNLCKQRDSVRKTGGFGSTSN